MQFINGFINSTVTIYNSSGFKMVFYYYYMTASFYNITKLNQHNIHLHMYIFNLQITIAQVVTSF